MIILEVIGAVIGAALFLALILVVLLLNYGGRQCNKCGSRSIKWWTLSSGDYRCVCKDCGHRWDEH